MRGIIVKWINPEEVQAIRCLQAIEGYLELGMFQEAQAELFELDPAWLSLAQAIRLESRIYAGLSQSH